MNKAEEKILSPGSVMKASDIKVEKIPTGIIELDVLTNGGIRKGSLTQLSGGYSSGKSTIALITTAAAQKLGMNCGWADVEGAFTPDYAEFFGVDTDKLLLMKGATAAESYLETIREWAVSGTTQLAVMDSVVAAGAMQEIVDKKGFRGLDQVTIAALARLWSMFLRTSWGAMHAKQFTFLCVNQIRTSGLGTMAVTERSTGGHALHHIARDEIALNKKSSSDALAWMFGDTARECGHGISLRLMKSSSGGIQGRLLETQFVYLGVDDLPEYGIASCLTLAYYAAASKIASKSANTYTLFDKKAVGKKGLWELIVTDSDVKDQIAAVYKGNKAKVIKTATTEEVSEEDDE